MPSAASDQSRNSTPGGGQVGAARQPAPFALHEERDRRLGVDAVALALEPAVEPPLHRPQPRPRRFPALVGEFVLPGPHQQLLRRGDGGEIARRAIGVEIAPAADVEHRAGDLVDRRDPRLPVMIEVGVIAPGGQPRRIAGEMLGPGPRPAAVGVLE